MLGLRLIILGHPRQYGLFHVLWKGSEYKFLAASEDVATKTKIGKVIPLIINSQSEKGEGMMKTSRRCFLKATATGIGSATLAGLCAVEAGATQFDRIKKWDYEAGALVLGIGAVGLMTAITAHDQGADVLILEKAPETHAGGNSRVCGQGYWCPSDSNKAVEYQKAMRDGYPIPGDRTKAFHEHSIHVTEWLTKMGADMQTLTYAGEYPEFPGGMGHVCRSTKGNGYQRLWLLLMENAPKKRKVRVQYETPAVELIRDVATGAIRGVVAENKGKKVYVKAKKAVVLCTGGFEESPDKSDFPSVVRESGCSITKHYRIFGRKEGDDD
jgi:3-oxosteroid 1-dehydrogenase